MPERSPPAPLREGGSSSIDESARRPTRRRTRQRSRCAQRLESRAGRKAGPTIMLVPPLGGGRGEPCEQAMAQSGPLRPDAFHALRVARIPVEHLTCNFDSR